ncbi:MAG TPA: ABC transporter permease [Edaphobacter sp.]|nr:ABC transporter permease [Edaphobacter sp.]
MKALSRIQSTVRNLFRKEQLERRLGDEIRAYVDMVTDERIAVGMSPSEARRTALIDCGGVERVKQAVREQRPGIGIELLWQDVRYALRQLRRNRAAALRVDPSFQITTATRANGFIDDVLQRVRAVPGIKAAAISDVLPLDGDRSWQVGAKGVVYDKNNHPEAYIRVMTDGYFEALGIPLKSGREVSASDRGSSEPVVMVNETLARTLWPGRDPVGQMMTQDGGRRVVGVVGDVHHGGPERSGGSEMYLPMRQTGTTRR